MRAYLDSWHEADRRGRCGSIRSRSCARSLPPRSAPAPTEIAVMPSASAGINAVASALRYDGSRTHVVIGDFEFPTMAQIWLAQERARRDHPACARIRRPAAVADAYAAAIDERTLDRARDARLFPQRPQDRHRRSGQGGARSRRATCFSTTISAPDPDRSTSTRSASTSWSPAV